MPSGSAKSGARGKMHQRHVSFNRSGLDRNLTILGAGRPHRAGALGRDRPRLTERVHGQHDAAAAAAARDRGDELGARLDVDELRAGRLRVGEKPLPLLFRPWKPPPSQDARHVTRTGAAGPRPRRSHRGRRQCRGAPPPDRRRPRRHARGAAPPSSVPSPSAHTGARAWAPKTKKPPQPGLRRLRGILNPAACRLTNRPLSPRIPPPIGRERSPGGSETAG